MTLARASLAASASAAMARCTHLQSWGGSFDPRSLIFLLLNPFLISFSFLSAKARCTDSQSLEPKLDPRPLILGYI